SAAMAKAVEENWPGELTGLVVTRYGYGVPCKRIEIVEAAHPVPDAAGIDAARRIQTLVQGLTADDLVLCLISGGGSSLLVAPIEGLTLEDKQAVNRALLTSGATISEMNCVRRHLSSIKGGRLAAACHPAKVVAGMALQLARYGQPFAAPCVLLSGGETTVTVPGNGRGGRNVEFLLSLGVALDDHPGIHAIAGDTDGVDGQEEIAGAYLGPD